MIHQLRIYEIDKKLKKEFDTRFKEHAIRIMKSYDFKIVSMWYSEYEGKTEFVYILQWPSEAVMKTQWEAFMADTEWAEIKRQSKELYGEMVLNKVRDQVLQDVNWFKTEINF